MRGRVNGIRRESRRVVPGMRVCGIYGKRGEGLRSRWGDPSSGTEPADHVGNGARKSRSLSDATIEGIDACAKWSVCVDFDVR